MFLPLLFAAVVVISVNMGSSSKKMLPASKTGGKGFIFKCSYIEITDMMKFRNEIQADVEKYFEINNIDTVKQLNLLSFYSYVIKKYNPVCYQKIMGNRLKSTEKI